MVKLEWFWVGYGVELVLCYQVWEQQLQEIRTIITTLPPLHFSTVPFVAHVTNQGNKGDTLCSSHPSSELGISNLPFIPSSNSLPSTIDGVCSLYASVGLSSSRPRASPLAPSSSSSSSSSSSPPWYSRCAPAGTHRPLSRSFMLLSWPERSWPTPSPICL